MAMITVKCPTCSKLVPWTAEQLFKPFCSKRCKLMDLGAWFNEENRIPDDTPLSEEQHSTVFSEH